MEILGNNVTGILITGVISLGVLCMIMAVVFVNYVKHVVAKIDNVSFIEPLMEDMKHLVVKVDKIFTTLEVIRETHALEIEQLKYKVETLEKDISKLKYELGRN